MEQTCTTIPDTDSIHCGLDIKELEQFCDIDDVRLGAWKCEGVAEKAKFIRQKCYLEQFYYKTKYKGKKIRNDKKVNKRLKIKNYKSFREIKITCAGLPKNCYKYVEWQKFKTGFKCSGKLTFKHVKGGVKLVDTEFTIMENTFKSSFENF